MSYLSVAHAMACERARWKVREAAMYLAQMGFSAEEIRSALASMATTEATKAIVWAEKHDAATDDREDLADEFRAEAIRERETGT